MKILIIGSGAREHAIATAFHRSKYNPLVIVSPGNAGIAKEFEVVELNTFEDVEDYCIIEGIDFVFIGHEKPLADGMADFLRKSGIRVVGPSKNAARIESSKAFAKKLMKQYDIPTADFEIYNTLDSALQSLNEWNFPIVIKADGLAAGKGVFIAHAKEDAERVIQDLMQLKTLDEAGSVVVIEDYLLGWEVSLFAFTDGLNYKTTLFSQDHKQLFDNDLGPNTGGMGAYAPVPEAEIYRTEIETNIIRKVLNALIVEQSAFSGVLYIGLMITNEGPKVVEFNARFGDPEAQTLLPLLENDFVDVCNAIMDGKISDFDLHWSTKTTVCVYAVTKEYPSISESHNSIEYRDHILSVIYYGAVADMDRSLVTNGGRVFSITSIGNSITETRIKAYHDLQNVHFNGMHFRTDIGLRTNKL